MTNLKRYLVYRVSDGLVVNVIVWDGLSAYDPGEGLALDIVPAGSFATAGWIRNTDGDYVAPVIEEAQPEIQE